MVPGNRPRGRRRVDACRVPRRPDEALLRVDKDAPVLVEHVIEAALDDDAERRLICGAGAVTVSDRQGEGRR